MVIYRPHKGGLADSMKEAKEFSGFDEMRDFIVDYWDGHIKYDDIILGDDLFDDKRIGWKNVRYVLTKGYYEFDGNYKNYIEKYKIGQCIGMCSENYQVEV